MRIYAVDQHNKCIELNFRSEKDADEAFNKASVNRSGVGEIIDMNGKKKNVNIYCGYSFSKGDIFSIISK